jgi:hypothetical protein
MGSTLGTDKTLLIYLFLITCNRVLNTHFTSVVVVIIIIIIIIIKLFSISTPG